jgi:hypothetical protein
MVAGGGDALQTQDNVRRDDAEHNDLSHMHNLTQSRTGRLHARARAYVARRTAEGKAHGKSAAASSATSSASSTGTSPGR